MERPRVAVIGTGVTGLATLKNLLEEGFDVTAFESRDTIGGIWKYTDKEDLSILESTISNKSRFKCSYTDFPYPKDASAFPTGSEVQAYLEAYAEKFNLLRHIRLNTPVQRIHKIGEKWHVNFLGGSEDFDKIAISVGEWGRPKMPQLRDRELFHGQVIHAKQFKRPSDFKGKRVVVIGFGNNAADISTSLIGNAERIYISHRSGANLLPRWIDGKPGDIAVTRRLIELKYALTAISPTVSERFFNRIIQSLTKKAFRLQPEWRIHPPPSFLCHQPTVSDSLVEGLENGNIVSKSEIRRFIGPTTVEFEDSSVEVDVVICCTGFVRDFSICPVELVKDRWSEMPKSDGIPLPRLFQNIFPPSDPSVAYLNNFSYPTGFMWIADLASMAVAQVWNNGGLPTERQMNEQIDQHHAWLTKLVERETVPSDLVNEQSWLKWCNDTAGTGIENLGWGWPGLKFWFWDYKVSGLLMGGVESPFALRLFDGKRKKWEGARQAVIDVNEEVRKVGKEDKKHV